VFGEYRKLEPGINLIPPFVSRTYAFDMRTQTLDVPRQEAITRDNSPVTADAVVYIKVMDAKKAFLEVDDYKEGRLESRADYAPRRPRRHGTRRHAEQAPRDQREDPQGAGRTDRRVGIRVESVEVREVNPRRMSSRRWSSRPLPSAAAAR